MSDAIPKKFRNTLLDKIVGTSYGELIEETQLTASEKADPTI